MSTPVSTATGAEKAGWSGDLGGAVSCTEWTPNAVHSCIAMDGQAAPCEPCATTPTAGEPVWEWAAGSGGDPGMVCAADAGIVVTGASDSP